MIIIFIIIPTCSTYKEQPRIRLLNPYSTTVTDVITELFHIRSEIFSHYSLVYLHGNSGNVDCMEGEAAEMGKPNN